MACDVSPVAMFFLLLSFFFLSSSSIFVLIFKAKDVLVLVVSLFENLCMSRVLCFEMKFNRSSLH